MCALSLSPFALYTGVVNYLSTEVSTSRQKKFSMVMFVDTPGLVDGDMNYPFDVDDAIVLLGKHVYIRTYIRMVHVHICFTCKSIHTYVKPLLHCAHHN